MSRRLRTLEILAAAQLAPQELARERERTARQSQTTNATLAALSSLIPAGANLAGTLADIETAKSDRAAKAAEAATAATRQKDLDALNRQNMESQVAERAAQTERAKADAASKAQTDLRANADKARERALDALRGRAAGGANEMDLRRVAMDDDALGDMDDDSVRGVMVGEQEKQAKAQAERSRIEAEAEKARRLPIPKPAPRGGGRPKPNPDGGPPGGGEPPKPKLQPLPAEAAKDRALKLSGIETVNKLREAKKLVKTGPIDSPVRNALGVVFQNPERREFNQLNNALQRVAGRILEGGKLAEGDAKNYEKFILDPSRLDDEDYDAVLDSVEEQLRTDLQFFDAEMAAAGRSLGSPAPVSNRTPVVGPGAAAAVAPPKKPADMTIAELEAELAGGG